MRFETAPGEQLQIDFGETTVSFAGEWIKVHLLVATLGYSRRPYVAVFEHQRQSAWWSGIEGAFHRGRRPADWRYRIAIRESMSKCTFSTPARK